MAKQERENKERKQSQEREENLLQGLGDPAPPDLSLTFQSLPAEATLTASHTAQYILPVTRTNVECTTTFSTSIKNLHEELFGDSEDGKGMDPGEFVPLPPAHVDGFQFGIQWFPKGHDIAPSGADLFKRTDCSFGVFLCNKLDVFHRLRRSGDPSILKIKISFGGGEINKTVEVDLSELVRRNIVFKGLGFGPEQIHKRIATMNTSFEIQYDKAWQRCVSNDDFRIKLYRNSLKYGDLEIYLIEDDSSIEFGGDEDDDDDTVCNTDIQIVPVDDEEEEDDEDDEDDDVDVDVDKKSSSDKEEKEPSPPIAINKDRSVKVSLTAVMSACPWFEAWFERFNMPYAIAISAPSLLYLGWFAFYCATGQLHDSSDAVWFAKLAFGMTDERMLQLATELCIQRLTKENVRDICKLFTNLKLRKGQGRAQLKLWIVDRKTELKQVMLSGKNDKRVDLFTACKNACWWW